MSMELQATTECAQVMFAAVCYSQHSVLLTQAKSLVSDTLQSIAFRGVCILKMASANRNWHHSGEGAVVSTTILY